jgi:putative ABC transport system permease protein
VSHNLSAVLHIKQAFNNIRYHFLRSFLTLLGVLVGTGAIVALLTGSELATQAALAQFKKLGTDLISLSFSEPNPEANHAVDGINWLELKKFSAEIMTAAPYTESYSEIYFKNQKASMSIMGVTEELAALMRFKLFSGRFVSDLDNNRFYCVLGESVAGLFNQDLSLLIGEQIKIEGSYFTVIGILKSAERNLFLANDSNQTIFIPIKAALSLYKNSKINHIIFKITSEELISKTQEDIKKYFQLTRPDTMLIFRNPESIIQNMQQQNHIFKLLLIFIGSIALLVGGIGVMNIMLVSVTERKREIGIRMAVGAQQKDILYLFLAEAAILTILGGVSGIILGEVIGYATAKFSQWEYHFFLTPVLVGFFVSILVGLFFGYYPAYKASKLNPIEILRSP